MKYIGIDYGLKRIGIAVSNEDGTVAFPYKVLKNNPDWIETLTSLTQENRINGGFVFGESRDLSMIENPLMKHIHEAINSLKKKSDLPIHLHPEFMTSREANRFTEETETSSRAKRGGATGNDEMHDARAAALILQHFLDSKNKQALQK